MKQDDLEGLNLFVQEIIASTQKIMKKQNNLCIKTGRIVNVSNNIYEVEIDKNIYKIHSRLSFSINETVGVLTNIQLTGKKYLLG